MKNFTADLTKKWEHENNFYLTCETSRIGKLMNHLEIYKKILHLPGNILEFGVYKGTSLIRFLSFRQLLENDHSREIIGFDMFGKFPDNLQLQTDRTFVKNFETAGGYGISREELQTHLNRKSFRNYSLIKGDILQTLPCYLEKYPATRLSLIDVDVYEPTKKILELLWPRLIKGGILMLDDYATVEGESRAVEEFFEEKGVCIRKPKYNYIPSYICKE